MSTQKIGFLIVGASLAGVRAAQAARREGYEGTITMLGAEPHLPYDRPPLSKEYLSDTREPDFFVSATELKTELNVTSILGTTAVSVDTGRKVVHTNTSDVLRYERLLIATGATPRSLPNLAANPHALTLRTADDALKLRQKITPNSHVVIIGAGFIGSEIASSARAQGAQVTIIEAAPVPLVRAVGTEVGQALAGLHEKNGTRLLVSTSIETVTEHPNYTNLQLSTGENLEANVIIVGIGAAPETTWLRDSAITLNARDGGVECNEYLCTSAPDVYAAGDLTHWSNHLMDENVRLENWTNAAEQGERAAINALFPDRARPFETVPYFWSDWYENRIQFVGSANADNVTFVSGSPNGEKFVALYRKGERLIGAATLNERRKIMKLRRHIQKRGTYTEAITLLG